LISTQVAKDRISLRPATTDDEPFLFKVYASTRIDELEPLGWDESQLQAFLKMQYRAQTISYPKADNRIISLDANPIGRLLVERREAEWCLVDIALLRENRNTGVGTSVIRDLLHEAATAEKPLRLHVLNSNPARRLYERLGFANTGGDSIYLQMTWFPPVHPQ